LSEIVGGHLDRLGHPLPSTANPADSTMLDLVRDLSRDENWTSGGLCIGVKSLRCEEPEV